MLPSYFFYLLCARLMLEGDLAKGKLAPFLTQMLRLGAVPEDRVEFVHHLRPLGLEWDTKNQIRYTGTHPEVENLLRTGLGDLLAKVDKSYTAKLSGAWQAYYSDNPERFRHAINSCRELLSDVTQKLGGTGQRKERVRKILGSESASEVVEAAAELVSSLYALQSAQEHTEPSERAALFALVETEHILYFLLTQRGAHN